MKEEIKKYGKDYGTGSIKKTVRYLKKRRYIALAKLLTNKQ